MTNPVICQQTLVVVLSDGGRTVDDKQVISQRVIELSDDDDSTETMRKETSIWFL